MRQLDTFIRLLRLVPVVALLAFLTPVAIAQNAMCGDGAVDLRYEQCDDGNTLPGDGCDASCFAEYDCNQLMLQRTGNTWTLRPSPGLDDTLPIQCAFDAAAAEYVASGASDIVIRLEGGRFYANEILASGFHGTLEGEGAGATVVDTVRGGTPGARGLMRTRAHPAPAVLVFEDGDFTVRGITFDVTPYSPADIPSRYAAYPGIQTVLPSAVLVTGTTPDSRIEQCEFIAHEGEGVTYHETAVDYGGNVGTALSYQGYAQYPQDEYPAEWPARAYSEPMGGTHVVTETHFQNVFYAVEHVYLRDASVTVTENAVDWGNLAGFFDNDGVDIVISKNIVTNGSWAIIQGGTFGTVFDNPPYEGRWPSRPPTIDISDNEFHYITKAFGLPEGQVAESGEGIALFDNGFIFGIDARVIANVSENDIVMTPVDDHETNAAIFFAGISEGTISGNDIEVAGPAVSGIYVNTTDHTQVVGNNVTLSGGPVYSAIDSTNSWADSILDTSIRATADSQILDGGIGTYWAQGTTVSDARFIDLGDSGTGLFALYSAYGEYSDLNFKDSGLAGWAGGYGAALFIEAPGNVLCDLAFPDGTDASDQVLYFGYAPAYCEE